MKFSSSRSSGPWRIILMTLFPFLGTRNVLPRLSSVHGQRIPSRWVAAVELQGKNPRSIAIKRWHGWRSWKVSTTTKMKMNTCCVITKIIANFQTKARKNSFGEVRGLVDVEISYKVAPTTKNPKRLIIFSKHRNLTNAIYIWLFCASDKKQLVWATVFKWRVLSTFRGLCTGEFEVWNRFEWWERISEVFFVCQRRKFPGKLLRIFLRKIVKEIFFSGKIVWKHFPWGYP